MLKLSFREDISLEALMALVQNGGSVTRTPHVGNFYAGALVMLELGIPTLILDRTFGRNDTLFHPSHILVGGKPKPLCNPELLMTHARVENEQEGARIGDLVSDVHMKRLRALYPDAPLMLFTDWFRANSATVSACFEALIRHNPNLWTRHVNDNGSYEERCGRRASDCYGLGNGDGGIISPNLANIIAHAVVECLTKKTLKVYNLCGHSMGQYMRRAGVVGEITRLYETVRSSSDLDLPDELEIIFVECLPGTHLTVREKDQEALDKLMELYLASLDAGRGEGERLARATQEGRAEEKSLLITQFETERLERTADILEVLGPLKEELLVNVKMARHWTHHDLALSGERLGRIPDFVFRSNLTKVNVAHRKLSRMRTPRGT